MDTSVGKRSSDSNEGKRIARAAIAVLLGLVFLGWLMMWIVMPTNTYKLEWQPEVRARSNSTYFGAQGANLLIYTFPILFIAVMGSVYLHLGKNSADTMESKHASNRLAIWRQPVLVKGPLGIVSGIELAFLAMFVALLIWSFTTFIRISFATINSKSADQLKEKVWEAKLDSAALRLGLVGNICLAFLFFPVARGSSILPLVGLTSESSIKYHIWLGHMVMAIFTAHGLCYIIYWAATKELSQMLKWDKIGVSNVAGELALICGLIMWVASSPCVRRKMFELFYYTHHLYFLFIFFFVLHVGMSFICIALPGVFLFLIDRYLRFLQSRQRVRLLSARILPCHTVELNFSKSPSLTYNPTSMMFVNVPKISGLQWHPFTVSSNSNLEEDKLSVIIKSEGSWSHKLYEILSSPSPLERLDVSIEGPYGPASTHFLRHEKLVMISGGSGITPLISITREIIYRGAVLKEPTPEILLICSFRSSDELTMLDLLLPITGTPSDISPVRLQLEAFVTREKEPNTTTTSQKLLQSVWFKPHPTDAPVSAVLGPRSWLWLGAIISSSFVLFLLLLGITTQYYIYPIDHNTNKIFSYSSRSLLNIFFVCVSIAATASAAALWTKKQSAMEGKQIQNMEGATPTASPGSWFYNADRELESLPHQSLVQSTKFHYGARPDIKKMLLECEEKSVGVIVSGPRGMRQNVAAVCSSGLAKNLHFESISFSW